MKRGWIATVQIVLPDHDPKGTLLDTPPKAADAVSTLLTEHAQGRGHILDWTYLSIGGQLLQPMEKFYDAARYNEGDAFK